MHDSIADAIESGGGILLEDQGRSILVDRLARRRLAMPDDDEEGDPQEVADAVAEFLREADTSTSHTLIVHVLIEAFDRPEELEAVRRVLDCATPGYRLKILVHFADPPSSWDRVLAWLGALRAWQPDPGRLTLMLFGPFTPLDDATKDRLFKARVHLEVVHGWWPGCSDRDELTVRFEALHDLAAFGFEVPALWYVHGGNVGAVAEKVEQCLQNNHYAGFSVPSIVQNPYYVPGPGTPPLPSAESYAELLVGLYHEHPHYDRTFAPLIELAELCYYGAWDSQADIASRLQVLFRGDGFARCFRQIPHAARPWMACRDILVRTVEDVRGSLAQTHRDRFPWSKNAYCGACRWRFLCGGLDHHDGEPASPVHDLVCGHRKLFLEAFVLQRFQDPAAAGTATLQRAGSR